MILLTTVKIVYEKLRFFLIKILMFIFLFPFIGCVDPVEPVFKNTEGLVYIDAFLSTTASSSFVTISESILDDGNLKFNFLSKADIDYRNVNTGTMVSLIEEENIYMPPNDFVAEVGSSWEIFISLPDGREYQSLPERIAAPVAISNIRATYNPELVFRESEEKFLPGHFVSIDIDDPTDKENYYYWKFTSFENLEVCQNCTNSILRNGECQENPIPRVRDYTVDYLCDKDCWQKRFNENIKIFSDEFTNGIQLNGLPVADVLLYSKENIIVEVQQFSLSRKAYEYYKVLKDIVDNNGGLNAPPPAALIGNMFNPQDENEFVLGRFTAAATVKKSIFIDRETIVEPPIEESNFLELETCLLLCLPEQCNGATLPCTKPIIITTSCSETRFQTAIEPEGWVE